MTPLLPYFDTSSDEKLVLFSGSSSIEVIVSRQEGRGRGAPTRGKTVLGLTAQSGGRRGDGGGRSGGEAGRLALFRRVLLGAMSQFSDKMAKSEGKESGAFRQNQAVQAREES